MSGLRGRIKIVGILAAGVAVGSMTGFFAGGAAAHQQLDAIYEAKSQALPETRKVIETEVIKRVMVPTQPESCARAAELAKQVSTAFDSYDAAYGNYKEVFRTLSQAIFDKKINVLNKAQVQLIKYDSETAGIAQELVESVRLLNEANLTCIKEVNDL